MFSSIPRETYFKAVEVFFKTNVFCLAFKLILLDLHLSCLTALTLAFDAHQELGGIHTFMSCDTHKKIYMQSSGDHHFHNKCLWWYLAVYII